MAPGSCLQYDWNTGACTNYSYAGNYNIPFHGYAGGQNDPRNPPDPQNPANPASPNAPGGPTTSFPGSGNTPGSLFPGTGQGSAAFATNDGIWWMVIAGLALWAVLKK